VILEQNGEVTKGLLVLLEHLVSGGGVVQTFDNFPDDLVDMPLGESVFIVSCALELFGYGRDAYFASCCFKSWRASHWPHKPDPQ
jgi:hypothetical protein